MKETKDILKQLRTERGLSQAQLANILHVSASAIGNYESGIRIPKLEIMELFADYFNVDLGYLYGKTSTRNCYRGIADTKYYMNQTNINLSTNIKCLRELSDRNLEEVANGAKIKIERYTEIEKGSRPSIYEISNVAAYYKIPEQWIINSDLNQICKDNRAKLAFYVLSLSDEITTEQLTEFKHYLNYILKR